MNIYLADRRKEFERPLIISLLITSVVMIIEFVGGVITNSLALISDAVHMVGDIAALLIGIIAFRFSSRPATEERTFGLYRLEILAAQINGGFLFFLSLFIFYEAYRRLAHPEPIEGILMIGIASVGLFANAASIIILQKASKRNLNIKAASWHVVGDLLSSFGVIAGGIIIATTGWSVIDPILGMAIGLVILVGAYRLVKETADILLEGVPRHIDLVELIREVESIPGVKSFHDVHVWTITSGIYALSGHVQIDDQRLSESIKITEGIKGYLAQHYGINHTTLQLECLACELAHQCTLGPPIAPQK